MSNKYDTCPACNGIKDVRAIMCIDCRGKYHPDTSLARLMSKVSKDVSGCWLFTGFLLPNGYGRIKGKASAQPVLAHRLSFELHKGPIPDGLFVCHSCDVRSCVNPDHLFAGTAADNIRDMYSKGRNRPAKFRPRLRNMGNWNTKLTVGQILEIRSRRREPRKILAQEFGTTARYISSIICGTKRKYAV